MCPVIYKGIHMCKYIPSWNFAVVSIIVILIILSVVFFGCKFANFVIFIKSPFLYWRQKETLHRKCCITWSINTALALNWIFLIFRFHLTILHTKDLVSAPILSKIVLGHHFLGYTLCPWYWYFCREISLKPWKVVYKLKNIANFNRNKHGMWQVEITIVW